MKKILTVLVCAIVLMPAAAKAGGDVTIDLPPGLGECPADLAETAAGLKTCEAKLQKSFGDLKACEEELAECKGSLEDCLKLEQKCEGENDALVSYIEAGCVGPKPPGVKVKEKPTGGGKKKPPKTDCQKCRSSKYNGICVPPDGPVASWMQDVCGVELELDGICLTQIKLHEVDKCLWDELETMKDEMASHKDVQKIADQVGQMTIVIRELEEGNDGKFKSVDTSLFAMKADLEPLEKRVAELEKWKRLMNCCIFVDDIPGYCSDLFEFDPVTELPTADSYAEHCGILAQIPGMQGVLDDHEARLKKLESQVSQNTKDIKDLKAKNLELKLPPWLAFEIGLAPMLLGTGLGDVYISPTALKIGLVIKHDGIDLFEIQGRFGVMLQANDAHDCERYGVGGGVDFFFYPGPQQIFGLGAGYAVASMGGYVIEYEDHVMPDGSTQIEPDRQDDFVLGKLKAKYYKNLKTKNNYLWGLGFEAEAGVGGVFMHDYWGTGWHVGYQFLFGIVFHLPVPGVPAPSDKPAEE